MADDPGRPRTPSRRVAGMEYDFRTPTTSRWKSRAWNADDARIFTPKTYGWGYGVNFFWPAHPVRWIRLARGR